MLRLLLVLFTLSATAPLLAACYWGEQPPPRVPVTNENTYKTCPGGGTNC